MKLYLANEQTVKIKEQCELSSYSIRQTIENDVSALVALSYQKRRAYEKEQPKFWKHAAGAEETQKEWFQEILYRDDHICLTAESGGELLGFIIGKLIKAPEVYDLNGLTLMVDDFCVKTQSIWETVGSQLIDGIRTLGEKKQAVQLLVVCGAHDVLKRQFLGSKNLRIVSEWYTGKI